MKRKARDITATAMRLMSGGEGSEWVDAGPCSLRRRGRPRRARMRGRVAGGKRTGLIASTVVKGETCLLSVKGHFD